MHSRIEHVQLTEKLFRDVIDHLKQRIRKLEALQDDDEDQAGLVDAERAPATIAALRLQICLYSLCLDSVLQQREELEGERNEGRRRARENFFRLMSTVAQSELTRDTHGCSFGLSSQSLYDRPLTDAQMFTALEGTAERQLAELIEM